MSQDQATTNQFWLVYDPYDSLDLVIRVVAASDSASAVQQAVSLFGYQTDSGRAKIFLQQARCALVSAELASELGIPLNLNADA